jgi:LysM repeat protein
VLPSLKLLFGIEEKNAMASMKRSAMVASILLLFAIIASACNQPYSTPPSVTNTPINSNSLFQTPLGQATSMNDVQSLATASALALSGTPAVGLVTATPSAITNQGAIGSVTPTTNILLPTGAVTTPSATMALSANTTSLPGVTSQPAASTSQPAATSVPGVRPASYALQAGEFVYCIARRFDVDPDQTLALNGLSDAQTIYPGLVLKIPQSGSFPGDRMLQNHPTTYTVVSSNETLYSIACKYGDVDPNSIAAANAIAVSAALSSGQQLKIP